MTPLSLSELQQHFSGPIVTPDKTEYEMLRSAFSRQGTPAVILQPKSAEDITLAIQYAKENSLILSIRSGGHSGGGFGTNENGVVIELSLLNRIEVIDREKNIFRIGSGAKWGEVAKYLEEFHVAISSGDTTSVGVGGLTLGGGIGWMVRKFGLALDSVVGAEVVTADGRVLHASKTENEDLFWAIRGGGGNFGVVTYFDFQAQPIEKVFTGTFIFKHENFEQLLKGWRDYLRVAPEELTSTLMALPAMGQNPPSIMMLNCFIGHDEQSAQDAFSPLLKVGTILSQDIKEKKYFEVLEEAHKPEGVRILSHTAFIDDLSNEAIRLIGVALQYSPTPMFMFRSLGGQMNRVPKDETAFAHRSAEALVVSATFLPLDAPDEKDHEFHSLWETIEPQTTGTYINFLSLPNEKETLAAYPAETYERLVQIKTKYDPENIFNQNYNIKPAK